MSYASQLKMMRQARGLTQEQLAERAGIPNNYLSLMETGKVVPHGEWDAKIRAALGWTPQAETSLVELLHYSSPEMTEKYAEAMAETMAG